MPTGRKANFAFRPGPAAPLRFGLGRRWGCRSRGGFDGRAFALLHGLEKGLRIGHELLFYLGMGAQILLKFGMFMYVGILLDERRILGEILCDVGMPGEEFAEVAMRIIRNTNSTRFKLVTVIAVFRAHERIRIFPQFFTDRGVLLHIGLQCRVVLQKLLVVDERWVLTNLLGDFAVAVEELVEARQLPPRDVAVTLVTIAVRVSAVGALVTLIPVLRAHERIRIFPQFFTDRGVLLHIGLQCRVVLQKLLVVDERWVLTNLLGDFAVAVE